MWRLPDSDHDTIFHLILALPAWVLIAILIVLFIVVLLNIQ